MEKTRAHLKPEVYTASAKCAPVLKGSTTTIMSLSESGAELLGSLRKLAARRRVGDPTMSAVPVLFVCLFACLLFF